MADNNNNGSWLGDTLKGGASSLIGGVPGALLSMGTSLIGSIFSNNMNRKNQAMTQAWQEKMNLQQQQWQEDMWNMNNAYNSPQAQMQRLQAAGLNPNNAAAAVLGTNATSQLAQQPTIPNGNPLPAVNMDLVGAMNEGMRTNKEMQLMEAEQEDIQASADLKRMQEGYTREQMAGQKVINGQMAFKLWLDWFFSPQERATNLKVLEAGVAKTLAETSGITYDNEIKQFNKNVLLPLMEQEGHAKIRQINQAISESVSRMAANYAQAAKDNAAKDLLQSQEVGQEEQNAILGFEKEIKSIVADQYREYGMPLNEMQLNAIAKLYIEEARRNNGTVGVAIDTLIDAYEDNVDRVVNDLYINQPVNGPISAHQRTVGSNSMRNRSNRRRDAKSNKPSKGSSSSPKYNVVRGPSVEWN